MYSFSLDLKKSGWNLDIYKKVKVGGLKAVQIQKRFTRIKTEEDVMRLALEYLNGEFNINKTGKNA